MTPPDPDIEATFRVCVISTDIHETEIPKKRILDELERRRYSSEAIFAIKLALEEALCNAIKHGNRHDPTKPVTVRYAVNDEKVAVIVRDEGGGFLPEEVPDPTLPDRIPLPCGRGILLMKAYMDDLQYRDEGREVYFMRRRARPAKADTLPTSVTLIRQTVLFSGSVQGVGFRYTTCEIARKFAVTGFVRNLRNGSVELVAEGQTDEIARFIAAVSEAMQGSIKNCSSTLSQQTGEFVGFSAKQN